MMNRPIQPLSDRRSLGGSWLPALLLVGAMVVVFGQVSGHQFLNWDDRQHIVDNPRLNPPTWHGVGLFWQKPFWKLYIPLSYTFFAGEASVARLPIADGARTLPNPVVFHMGNLLLHTMCVLLVFAILRSLFRSNRAACAGALLFGLHPVQVESVAWVSETRGLLCALFSLLAIWQYLEHTATDRQSGKLLPTKSADRGEDGPVEIVPYLLATVCFVAALLCNTAAVAVPLIVALLDWGLLRRPWRRILWPVAPWLLLAAGFVVVTKSLQPDSLLVEVPPLWARPLLAGDALAFYLVKLIAPLQCGPDYGHEPAWVMRQSWFYFAWLLPVAVLVGLAWMKHRRLWLVAAAVSIAWVLPVLGFVPFAFQRFSTVADRYLYLALLGPAIVLCWVLTHRWNRWTVGLTSMMLCLLAVLSAVQAGYWRNEETFYHNALRVNPRSVVARHNWGFHLDELGHHAEAVQQYRDALKEHPLSLELHLSLATSLSTLGRDEEALEMLDEAIERLPPSPRLHGKRGDILRALDRSREAEAAYQAAIALDPGCYRAHSAWGELLRARGQTQAAIEHYRKAIEAEPEYVEAYVNLAVVLKSLDRFDEARYWYEAALRQRPGFPSAHYNLGLLATAEGNRSEAIKQYRAALASAPDYAWAHVNLGIALAEQQENRAAIEHYRAALAIDPELVPAYVNLGNALIVVGRTKEAVAAYQNALQRVSPQSRLAEQLRHTIQTYVESD
ncbi:MAG TPA: tetratricopeptide repeat protein [Thermoguttaceae bacterium]|nr:tetratricopeptide repeat protein [Thermoguttaceae bacterium]